MAGLVLHQFSFKWTIWILCSILLFHHCIECNRKIPQAHRRSRKDSESESEEEDETPITPPQTVGIKGLASAGISYLRSSQTVPKCLGQDIRLDKVTQVTIHCEGETGEGKKNETEGMQRSLCFTACMYRYLGLIGDDLMFTAKIDTVVIDIFPSIAHILAKKALRSCAKQTVLPLSKSDNCTSFGPVKGCILRNINNVCSGEYR